MTFNKRYLNLNRYFLYATYFAVKRVGWGERFCEPQPSLVCWHYWGLLGAVLLIHRQPTD